ncbi:hypothetical protein IQ257_03555 [Coleofasciculus sp. LEGE 07092]|nr:hypothetical protein [Coleofasciculus sp. LEGE 07081]MBE9147605.1 hypothetical protein [Coleofasciculus sp. LEGE 07092]
MTLTACSNISDRSEPTPTARESLEHQRSQAFKSTNSTVQAKNTTGNANRQSYKPIDLSNRSDTDLIGSDPKAIALSVFGLPESEPGSQSVTVDYPQPDQAIVTLIQTGIGDDSVNSTQYRVELEENLSAQTGKHWEMVWAGSQFKCQPGRGHQDWSAELCL